MLLTFQKCISTTCQIPSTVNLPNTRNQGRQPRPWTWQDFFRIRSCTAISRRTGRTTLSWPEKPCPRSRIWRRQTRCLCLVEGVSEQSPSLVQNVQSAFWNVKKIWLKIYNSLLGTIQITRDTFFWPILDPPPSSMCHLVTLARVSRIIWMAPYPDIL